MKRYLLLALVPCLILSGCEKRFTFDKDLSLSTDRYELSADGGQTPVIVYANGDWTAAIEPAVSWARLEDAKGHGLGQLRFIFDANEGIARKATIVVRCSGNTMSVNMLQKSGYGDIEFAFSSGNISIARNAAAGQLPFTTNLPSSELSRIEAEALTENGEPVSWLGGMQVSGDNLAFKVEANAGGEARIALLTLSYTDDIGISYSASLRLTQTADAPYLSFSSEVVGHSFSSLAATASLPFTSNLGPYLGSILAAASSSASWAKLQPTDDGGIAVEMEENEAASARSCTLTFPFTDADGATVRFTFILTQKGRTPRISFETVRALAAGGSYDFTEDAAVECVAIYDAGDPNLECNPNRTQTELDRSVNARTGYVQNADGTLGLRLRFASAGDNILRKGDLVTIDLAGLTLTKEDEPERYTLSGISTANISVTGSTEPVQRKLTLSELKDSDLYTIVTVSGLEFSFKHGAYTNCHDGYSYPVSALNPAGEKTNMGGSANSSQKYDTTPCSTRDAFGNELNLLINNDVTWRRYGNGVPQGVCDISGILVHSELARWARNGWLGRYQLRPSAEEDIVSTGERFSHVIASWHKGWGDTQLKGDEAIASGLEPATAKVSTNLSSASVLTVTGFNDLTNYTASPVVEGCYKGQRYNAALGFRMSSSYFWASDNTSDMSAAPWFQLECSTAGMSGTNLVFIWSAAQGQARTAMDDAQGPTQYRVEYSTDGTAFTAIETIYAMHPVVAAVEKLNGYSVPGLHQYVTPLPASLLGKDRIYVRIRAASNISSDASFRSPEGGTVAKTGTSQVRIGELTLEYN